MLLLLLLLQVLTLNYNFHNKCRKLNFIVKVVKEKNSVIVFATEYDEVERVPVAWQKLEWNGTKDKAVATDHFLFAPSKLFPLLGAIKFYKISCPLLHMTVIWSGSGNFVLRYTIPEFFSFLATATLHSWNIPSLHEHFRCYMRACNSSPKRKPTHWNDSFMTLTTRIMLAMTMTRTKQLKTHFLSLTLIFFRFIIIPHDDK